MLVAWKFITIETHEKNTTVNIYCKKKEWNQNKPQQGDYSVMSRYIRFKHRLITVCWVKQKIEHTVEILLIKKASQHYSLNSQKGIKYWASDASNRTTLTQIANTIDARHCTAIHANLCSRISLQNVHFVQRPTQNI